MSLDLGRFFNPVWRSAVRNEAKAAITATQLLPELPRLYRSRMDMSVAEQARKRPHQRALWMGEQRFTYRQLDDRINQVGRVLQDDGLKRGDTVALCGANTPEYLVMVLALSRLGVVAALVGFHLRQEALAHAITAANPTSILACDTFRQHISSTQTPVTFYDGHPFLAAVETASSDPLPAVSSDDFVLIYTSGTTGFPKACRVSHKRATLAGVGFAKVLYKLTETDVLYSALPLYHSNALLLGFGACVSVGATYAMRESFSASEFLPDLRRYGATAMLYIGEVCRYLLATEPSARDQDHSVRVAVGNGLRPDIWASFQERFGIAEIREFYGATESPAFIANLSSKIGSVGRIPKSVGYFNLVQFDDSTQLPKRNVRGRCIPCADDQPGELLVRLRKLAPAGLMFRGYTDPKSTAAKVLHDVFRKGDRYFRTGDLLKRDALGYLYFVDRIGDTYRWKGENVSTEEVAEQLRRHSKLLGLVVVGVEVPGSDGRAGMCICGNESEVALLTKAVKSLPNYARPVFVRCMQTLRTTGTFKVQKFQLAKEGVNPAKVPDPLFVWQDGQYVPLSNALYEQICNRAVRL